MHCRIRAGPIRLLFAPKTKTKKQSSIYDAHREATRPFRAITAHRTITMAAIASINAVARVAAPKVRRLSSRLAPRAFSDRAPRQYFRDEASG